MVYYRRHDFNFGFWFSIAYAVGVIGSVLYVFWTQGVFEVHQP